MFEKLLLAITITFSLNLCLQVRQQDRTNTDTSVRQNTQTIQTILVSIPKDKN
jgi:hypothetical protein